MAFARPCVINRCPVETWKQCVFLEQQPQALIRKVAQMLLRGRRCKKQSDYREIDESLSEFEWARNDRLAQTLGYGPRHSADFVTDGAAMR